MSVYDIGSELPDTRIDAVAAFTPDRSVSIEQVAGTLALSRPQTRMYRRIHGLDRLPDDPDLPLLELLREPAERLLRALPDRAAVRHLIFAHTIQDITPASIDAAQQLAAALGLPRAEAFALTQQNCASGLAAIDVAGELLRADGDPDARVLVVTGEKPFSRMARVISNTTIMGEASAACLVGVGPGRPGGFRVLSYVVSTRGEYADVFRPGPEASTGFQDTYVPAVVDMVGAVVKEAGLTLDDIAMVLPHNVNRSSWRQITPALGLGADRVYLDNIARTGHCFCSDPFLNLVSLRDEGRLAPGGRYLLTAVGLGATYAAMVIEHIDAEGPEEEDDAR
jgi:3-oxoacyl-[acyl-carrier-protein] synthase-3